VSVTGLQVDITGFVHLEGNFGFQKLNGNIQVAANSVIATLGVGTGANAISVGLSNGTLALALNADGTKALEASGALSFNAAGFASASAQDVRVKWNTTTNDYSGAGAALNINIDGVSAS